jgi:hypothetical protein
MKKIYFYLLFTIISMFNLIGQIDNYNNLPGDWFLIHLQTQDNIEILTFAKDKADSSFRIWNFGKNDTLHISAGFEIGYKKDKKENERMYVCNESSYYRFSLDKQKGKLSFINDNLNQVYDIINLDSKVLKLNKKKNYSYKQKNNDSKRICYYSSNLNSDSSIFRQDTIKVSKTALNVRCPRIEIVNDLNFTFIFNIVLDTIRSEDKSNNTILTRVVEKSKQIEGDWKPNDLKNKVRLIFKNSTIIDYDIIEKASGIYLIRKK